MKGLIVKENWLDLILDGSKPWEIRGSNTKIRGRIFLIQSGTGKVFGSVDLVNSIEVNKSILIENRDMHCIDDLNIIKYKKPHAWVLENPCRYNTPLAYKHPQGAVIWVNLDLEGLE